MILQMGMLLGVSPRYYQGMRLIMVRLLFPECLLIINE